MADVLLGREDDPAVEWLTPRSKILKTIASVGGIAAIAKADRKTVYRRGIAPGTVYAVEFVRDRRAAIGRPLVRRKYEPILTPRFREVLLAVRRVHAMKSGNGTDDRQKRSRSRLIDPQLNSAVPFIEGDRIGHGPESITRKEMSARKMYNGKRWKRRREGHRDALDGTEVEIPFLPISPGFFPFQ